MSDKGDRWIVAYRRYSSDSWSEYVFSTERAARQFARDKDYNSDHHAETSVNRYIRDRLVGSAKIEMKEIRACDKCDLCEDHHD